MDNFAYATSYPDSAQSSPRSREIDFDSTATWDEQQQQSTAQISPKAKFMCSYGGKIQPRPHDNQLAYTGGETKILVVDRSIKFLSFIGRLSALCESDVCFKYQLPGEDLDALISVTNDDDLDHMMHEYDRLCRLSSKPARLRLFLFPTHTPTVTPSGSLGSSERERLVEALNCVPTPQAVAPPPSPPAVAAVLPPANTVDFLFGTTDKIVANNNNNNQVQQVPATITHHVPEDPIQRHIQDLKRLQIVGQGEGLHRRIVDDNNLNAGFCGEYYTQKVGENLPAVKMGANNLPGQGGMYQTTGPGPEQAVYMMPTQTGMYHQVPMGRIPVTASPNQGYYTVQTMPPPEFYRDHQQPPFGMGPQAIGPQAMGPHTMGPGPQAMGPTGYSERFGIARSSNTNTGGVGLVDPNYARAYDNGMGMPIYYNTPAGIVASQYNVQPDMRGVGVATSQEGKVVKTTQGSV